MIPGQQQLPTGGQLLYVQAQQSLPVGPPILEGLVQTGPAPPEVPGAHANAANELTAGVASTASAKSNSAARQWPKQA